MKLAIVRQKYTPFGGAERFVERALVALAAKGVDVTMVARQWQGEAASGVHSLRLDPFYLGRTWRDAGFARAVPTCCYARTPPPKASTSSFAVRS